MPLQAQVQCKYFIYLTIILIRANQINPQIDYILIVSSKCTRATYHKVRRELVAYVLWRGRRALGPIMVLRWLENCGTRTRSIGQNQVQQPQSVLDTEIHRHKGCWLPRPSEG